MFAVGWALFWLWGHTTSEAELIQPPRAEAFHASQFKGIWGPGFWGDIGRKQRVKHINTAKSPLEKSFRLSPTEGLSTKYLTSAPVKVIKNQEKSGKLSQPRGTQRDWKTINDVVPWLGTWRKQTDMGRKVVKSESHEV